MSMKKLEHTIATNHPRVLLQQELARRCAKNPNYSLRAFSQSLGISHTVLSLVLSGKRPLSKKATSKVAMALGLSPVEAAELARNREASPSDVSSSPVLKVQQMGLDTFAVISDWYHYAILSLLETPHQNLEPKALGRRLGITAMEAKLAVDRLQRLGLITQVDGRWKQLEGAIRIDDESSTAATRKFQKQLLQKALESLENDPVDRRDISSMTLAFDPKHLPQAAERIKKFRRSLAQELEAQGTPTEVYNLTIQLYPITKPVSQNTKE